MERDLLLRLLRGAAAHGAGRDRRHRGRDGDRGCAHRAAHAPAGWNTAYLNLPQAAGLATERLADHIGQRMRWARGMVQILRLDNPLFGRGLKLAAAALLLERDAALPVRRAALHLLSCRRLST